MWGHVDRGPNFFLIGAARSGTTAMAYMLQQHPDVFVTRPKEPHYLAFAGRRPAFRGPGDELNVNRLSVTDHADYLRLYDASGKATARGDASASTLYYCDEAVVNLRRFEPAPRLIVLLRDPSRRSFSSYQYQAVRGFETTGDFARALDLEEQRIRNHWQYMWHYTKASFYSHQIETFLDEVGPDRFLILFQEDLEKRPNAVLRRAFGFLRVDPEFEVRDIRVNASGQERRPFVQKVIRALGSAPLMKDLTDHLVPYRLRERIRTSNLDRVDMDPSLRLQLDQLFRDDVSRLRSIIERHYGPSVDMPAWLETPLGRAENAAT